MNLTKCTEEELRELLDNNDITLLEYIQNAEGEHFMLFCEERDLEQDENAADEYIRFVDRLV